MCKMCHMEAVKVPPVGLGGWRLGSHAGKMGTHPIIRPPRCRGYFFLNLFSVYGGPYGECVSVFWFLLIANVTDVMARGHRFCRTWSRYLGDSVGVRHNSLFCPSASRQIESCETADEFYSTMGRLTQEMLEHDLLESHELMQVSAQVSPPLGWGTRAPLEQAVQSSGLRKSIWPAFRFNSSVDQESIYNWIRILTMSQEEKRNE